MTAARVRVRLFARLREQAGQAWLDLELPEGSTAGDALAEVGRRYPDLDLDPGRLRAAVNEELVAWSAVVGDQDELALIPPVSGGAGVAVLIEIGTEPLDARRLEAAVTHPGAGGICTFTGVVRDNARGRSVTHLEYEAFAEMAKREMQKIADEIAERWPEARVAMAHRTGRLDIGEASVVVSASCPHRAEAFEACRWGIDRLKESVPIWKKEFASDGEVWIEGAEARRA
ncbi:MAG TPA: molybdenum cofactor biosynthesis protein MoaE [Candidatus Dormibacteraeota bacterium]